MERNKSKLLIGIVLLLVGGALLFWALTRNNSQTPVTEDTTIQTQNSPSSEEDADIETTEVEPEQMVEPDVFVFTSGGFSPSEMSVRKGTVITVRNESSSNVQFSSDDHPTHLENSGMNLKVLKPGESATFTADKIGTWGFHDHIDDSKTGTLTVTE